MIASGCEKRGCDELVGDVDAERLPERDLDEVDADGVAREVGHLPAGDPRRDLDDAALAVGRDDQLRERDPVPQAERVNRRDGGLLRARELIAEQRRRVEVRPPDAEADPRRPQPVGQRQQLDLAVARDREPVQLEPVVERLDDRLAACATQRAPRAGAPRGRRASRA